MDNAGFAEKLKKEGLVAVIRPDGVKEGEDTADACVRGGVKMIEIAFTFPLAERVIAALSERYSGTDVVIGAGTVTDAETAKKAVEAGAKFVVSPCSVKTTADYMRGAPAAYVPGVATPTEYFEAVRDGAAAVKLFPASSAGTRWLKALRGPFPDALIMPTGGVRFEDLGDWFAAGAAGVGAGGELVRGAKTGDYAAVEREAGRWIKRIKEVKKG